MGLIALDGHHMSDVIKGSCHKYHFCRDKHVFVVTKMTKCIFCCDKSMLVVTKVLL